ncbi:hypothetical protein [Microbacterium sp. CJ88]|uniref:hypothetical protein n=1 Tax=Microbacterium sp. CJ88 TaxID=3445672 RepID=UPI003F657921
MPRPPSPLPPGLSEPAFTVSRALEFGVSRARLRAGDLTAPFHGVRLSTDEPTLLERCQARGTRLPGYAAFSHVTAALLHELPLPPVLAQRTAVDVSVPRGARAPAGGGTRGHQVVCRDDEADRRYGVLCTTPARTFCDLAPLLSLGELVAVGDAVLRRALSTHEDLRAAVRNSVARRGRIALARAVELLDPRAESPKESELRVVLTEAGLTPDDVNLVIRDRHGAFVARVDLAFVAQKIVVEYEGDHHRQQSQWRRDIARRRRIEALGWTYLSVTQADLDDPSALLADLNAALAR